MTSTLNFTPAEKAEAKRLAETHWSHNATSVRRYKARNVIIARKLIADIEGAAQWNSVTALAAAMRELVQFMIPDPEEQ